MIGDKHRKNNAVLRSLKRDKAEYCDFVDNADKFNDDMKTTSKQEVKDEFKNTEGRSAVSSDDEPKGRVVINTILCAVAVHDVRSA